MLQFYCLCLFDNTFFEINTTFWYKAVHFFKWCPHIHSKSFCSWMCNLSKVASWLVDLGISIIIINTLGGEIVTHLIISILAINVTFLRSETTILILTSRPYLIILSVFYLVIVYHTVFIILLGSDEWGSSWRFTLKGMDIILSFFRKLLLFT